LQHDKLFQANTRRSSSNIDTHPPHILIDSQLETETQISQRDIESHVLAHQIISNSSIPIEEIYIADLVPMELLWKTEGCRIPLTKPRFTMGRSASCDVSIPAPEVSSVHCELLHEGGGWSVYDLQSRNGILVNGEKVKQAKLRHGDKISISHIHHFYVLDPRKPNPFLRRWVNLLLAVAWMVAAGGCLWWYFFT